MATLGAATIASVLDRCAPFPSADVSRGSEAAFLKGLDAREIEGGIVQRRWAGDALIADFVHLPPGPFELSVALRGHRHPVTVAAAGAILGLIPEGRSRGSFDLPEARGGRIRITLQTETFLAGDGRRLGFMPERISLRYPAPQGLLPWSLLLVFLGPTWAMLLGARLASSSAAHACLLALAGALAQASALWPHGIVRSPYATELSWLVSALVLMGALWARRSSSNVPQTEASSGAGYAFAALVLALWVQGVATTHPCLVTSDGVFHANKVKAAAAGDWKPVSLTPHVPPFKFPYGVAFHLLVSPLLEVGISAEAAVRMVAAGSSLLASAVLLRTLMPWGAGVAAVAVCLLQLLPTTFAPFSAGNFSNVFAQAVTVLFLCWEIGRRPWGWPLGAALLALAGTAHFGAFLVLLVLGPALVIARGATRDLEVLRAVALGLGLAGFYYIQFLPLMVSQLPRILGGGRSGGPGIVSAVKGQVRRLISDWGWPVSLAALLGAIRLRGRTDPMPRAFVALWVSGGLLAVVAIGSPLEVRYLYALAPAVALLAAEGLDWLGRQRVGLVAASVLVLCQAGLAARGLVKAVLFTYRLPS